MSVPGSKNEWASRTLRGFNVTYCSYEAFRASNGIEWINYVEDRPRGWKVARTPRSVPHSALAWNRVKLLITLPSTAKSGERWCHWSNFGVHAFTVPYGQERSGKNQVSIEVEIPRRFIEKRICVSMITQKLQLQSAVAVQADEAARSDAQLRAAAIVVSDED